MGKFLSTMLLEAQLLKNIVTERLWLEDNDDGITKRLVFDSAVDDVKDTDVILTAGKGVTSKLYVVSSRRKAHLTNKVFTYAPFQRNPHVNIDTDVAREVFKALKGQSETIIMPAEDRQQLISRGAEMVNEKISDVFDYDITHVVAAPSASQLASDFAAACTLYINENNIEARHPFGQSRNLPNSYQKANNLDRIYVSPEMFDFTLKNIIEKNPDIDQADANEKAQKHVDDAERALLSAKTRVTRARDRWEANRAANPQLATQRPNFSVSEIPHKYRIWIDGFIEPVDNNALIAAAPKIVAVVDDNVDTGHTVFQIAKHLYELGAEHVVGVALYKFTAGKTTGPHVEIKPVIDHSKKFWASPTSTWSKDDCFLAKLWLLKMVGKMKTQTKIPFDLGFVERFSGKEEEFLYRADKRLADIRANEVRGESVIKIKKSALQKMIREAMSFGRDDYPAADDFTPEAYEPAIPHRPCKTCCGFGGGTVGEAEEECSDCEGTGLQRAEHVGTNITSDTSEYSF